MQNVSVSCIYIVGVTVHPVSDFSQMEHYMEIGNSVRCVLFFEYFINVFLFLFQTACCSLQQSLIYSALLKDGFLTSTCLTHWCNL